MRRGGVRLEGGGREWGGGLTDRQIDSWGTSWRWEGERGRMRRKRSKTEEEKRRQVAGGKFLQGI